jgi:hypothetical protein
MRTRILILNFLILFMISASCRRNHFIINTSKIELDLKIKRLEADLFSVNPLELKDRIPHLREKYDGFLQYFGYVINIGEPGDSAWGEGLLRFSTDKLNNEVYTKTMEVYPDIRNIEEDLTESFRHFRYYFPRKTVPGVFSCITGFNNSIILSDSILGIGLDRYLGSDCKFYPELQLYKYQTAKMNPVNIVPDCMFAWATREWDYKEIGYATDNVIASMIHEGKLLYFVRSMLPESDVKLIFGFTEGQMKFCKNNESQMWQYLIEHNLLFSSDQLTKRKLTGEAPFTLYFTNESPGRAAAWIGYRIIESYMMNNKGVTLENLMGSTDIQGILEKARYNPK